MPASEPCAAWNTSKLEYVRSIIDIGPTCPSLAGRPYEKCPHLWSCWSQYSSWSGPHRWKYLKGNVSTPVLIDSMSSTCPPHPRTAMDQQRTGRVPLFVGELVIHDVGQLDQLDKVPCILRGWPVQPVGELDVDNHTVRALARSSVGHVQLSHYVVRCLG